MDVKRSEIHRKISQYYNDSFRGETTLLQVVVSEWRMTKHQHTNRPRGSHCFKCRLEAEISQLARLSIFTHKKPPVLWFNDSDVENMTERRKEKIRKLRTKQWTDLHKSGGQKKLPARTKMEGDEIDVDADDGRGKLSKTEEEVSDSGELGTRMTSASLKKSPRRKKMRSGRKDFK